MKVHSGLLLRRSSTQFYRNHLRIRAMLRVRQRPTPRTDIDFAAIRHGLGDLPRASRHEPGATVDPEAVYTPATHRGAVDPERPLVVGNRGAGKSFWSHALLNPQ